MIKKRGTRTYYTILPENVILATLEMFFENKKPIIYMPFLIETISGNEFHALRVGCYFNEFIQNDFFKIQFKRKKVYVFTNRQGEIRHA